MATTAQEAADVAVRAEEDTAKATSDVSRGMDDALKTAEDNVPDKVSVGDKTWDVDEKAVKDALEAERKFWQNDA